MRSIKWRKGFGYGQNILLNFEGWLLLEIENVKCGFGKFRIGIFYEFSFVKIFLGWIYLEIIVGIYLFSFCVYLRKRKMLDFQFEN